MIRIFNAKAWNIEEKYIAFNQMLIEKQRKSFLELFGLWGVNYIFLFIKLYYDLTLHVSSSSARQDYSRDIRNVGITEIRWRGHSREVLAGVRVTRSPVPLSRNEAVFKPGTYRLFIQISNTHVKLSPPFSSPLDRLVLSPSPVSRDLPAQFTNQYFTVCTPAVHRQVGG